MVKFYVGKGVKEKHLHTVYPNIQEDEQIMGVYSGKQVTFPVTKGIIVITNQRILYVKKSMLASSVDYFAVGSISGAKAGTGMHSRGFKFTSDAKERTFLLKSDPDMVHAANTTNEIINSWKQQSSEIIVQNTQEDPMKTLKIRYAKGEITKEEFEEMKDVLES